jgi:hypothetical protein
MKEEDIAKVVPLRQYEILEFIKKAGVSHYLDIASKLKMNANTVSKIITFMVREGNLERIGGGKYDLPAHYSENLPTPVAQRRRRPLKKAPAKMSGKVVRQLTAHKGKRALSANDLAGLTGESVKLISPYLKWMFDTGEVKRCKDENRIYVYAFNENDLPDVAAIPQGTRPEDHLTMDDLMDYVVRLNNRMDNYKELEAERDEFRVQLNHAKQKILDLNTQLNKYRQRLNAKALVVHGD